MGMGHSKSIGIFLGLKNRILISDIVMFKGKRRGCIREQFSKDSALNVEDKFNKVKELIGNQYCNSYINEDTKW